MVSGTYANAAPTTGSIAVTQVIANQRKGSCTPMNKYPINATTPCINAIRGMPMALALTVVSISLAMRSTFESLKGYTHTIYLP